MSKVTIEFDDKELLIALKKHFNIKGDIVFYHVRSFFGKGHTLDYIEAKK